MATRPFKLVNHSETQRLCERVSATASRWAQDWLSAALTNPKVEIQTAPESIELRDWTAKRVGTETAAAVGIKKGDTSLRVSLTGTAEQSSLDLEDPMLEELERKAIQALLESSLGSGDRTDIDMPAPQEFEARGSGYVVLQCRWEGALELHLLLWPKTVEAWLGQAGTKTARRVSVSRLDALDTQTVKLEVIAGEAEIAFDELRSLCEGVIIKLDRRLDQPLQLRVQGDGVVCAGHLGLNDDRRAIQVVATS